MQRISPGSVDLLFIVSYLVLKSPTKVYFDLVLDDAKEPIFDRSDPELFANVTDWMHQRRETKILVSAATKEW